MTDIPNKTGRMLMAKSAFDKGVEVPEELESKFRSAFEEPEFDGETGVPITLRNQVNREKTFVPSAEDKNTAVNCVLEPEYIEMVDFLCEIHQMKRPAVIKAAVKFALNRA